MQSKDGDKGNALENFRPITLFKTEINIGANMLAKMLALVADRLGREPKTCAIPNRTIQNNLHSMRYIIGSSGTKVDFGLLWLIWINRKHSIVLALTTWKSNWKQAVWNTILETGSLKRTGTHKVNGKLSDPFDIARSLLRICTRSNVSEGVTVKGHPFRSGTMEESVSILVQRKRHCLVHLRYADNRYHLKGIWDICRG